MKKKRKRKGGWKNSCGGAQGQNEDMIIPEIREETVEETQGLCGSSKFTTSACCGQFEKTVFFCGSRNL